MARPLRCRSFAEPHNDPVMTCVVVDKATRQDSSGRKQGDSDRVGCSAHVPNKATSSQASCRDLIGKRSVT